MILIAQYRGKSITSRIIKFITRGEYSHTAVILEEDRIVEAWQGCNEVRVINSLGDGHKKGTPVDVYELDCTAEEEKKIRRIMDQRIGDQYDYWGLMAFYLNKSKHNRIFKWFCSEYTADPLIKVLGMYHGYKAWQVSPSMIPHHYRLALKYRTVTE